MDDNRDDLRHPMYSARRKEYLFQYSARPDLPARKQRYESRKRTR